jgi:hypothetical protein
MEGQLTLEAAQRAHGETSTPVAAGWRSRLGWLSSVESLDVPEWTRARVGRVAYCVAVTVFLLLTIVLKDAPGPGWLILMPIYVFIGALALCVAVPRRAE